MVLSFILGFMMFAQQQIPQNSFTILKDRQIIENVTRTDFSPGIPELPIINEKKYNQFLTRLEKKYFTAPENAQLDIHGVIIPERVGYQLNRKVFTEQFYSYYFGQRPATMELPMQSIYPRVDSELLVEIKNKRIGRYVTSFNSNNKKRSTNIQLAAMAINNAVVFPGETFSFNKVVGKRTVAKGYLRAKVIVRGEFAEDIGGGICQVSSTLFNAVDNAGLKIVQRFSHSRKVPYIPPGRDATVSWYGPDFVFKNTYNQPVLIRAATLGNLLIIRVLSSDEINYQPRKVPFPPY